ncbi:MAG TPA: RidA family protein [Beijerinckiaceae bacterium]|nr:RidA family protein [Beijerinckiaceae bacterium]
MTRLGINPQTIAKPLARYSHGALQGPWLFSSGQLGAHPDGSIPEDVEAQCVLCFENLKAILADAGMTFANVMRFNAYVTDRAFFPIYGKVRDQYVEGSDFASTLVIVSGFTRPEFKVEVEITAFKGDVPET